MYVTTDELRTHLRLPAEDFDTAAASLAIEGAEGLVVAVVGSERFEQYASELNSDAYTTVRSIVLGHAGRRYTNPESVMQRRLGADYSVSFADSSETARGLSKQETRMLKDAFKLPRFASVTLTAGPWEPSEPELLLE